MAAKSNHSPLLIISKNMIQNIRAIYNTEIRRASWKTQTDQFIRLRCRGLSRMQFTKRANDNISTVYTTFFVLYGRRDLYKPRLNAFEAGLSQSFDAPHVVHFIYIRIFPTRFLERPVLPYSPFSTSSVDNDKRRFERSTYTRSLALTVKWFLSYPSWLMQPGVHVAPQFLNHLCHIAWMSPANKQI